MFTHPKRLRRLAVHVLLVWLFALGTGIVNACVVQLHMPPPAPIAAQSVLGDNQQTASLDAEAVDCATVHQHDQQGDQVARTHLPCERLCDGPSVAPQPEKQQSNLLSGFWLAPAPVPAFDFQSLVEPARIAPSEPVRWRKTIPISIAFLRLAL
jgi:hypothetical protein